MADTEHDNDLLIEEEIGVSDGGEARFAAVDVKSGEEKYDLEWSDKVKISRFDEGENQWKERGQGEAKVLRKKDDATSFLFIVRRDGIGKLAAQHLLVKGMKIKRHPSNEKFVIWTAPKDYSDDDEGFEETFLCRFGSKDAADAFILLFERLCKA
mmetsp:Transcript_23614/g.27337  ORF Transcript_23614/g.27337 Transcript_23614/m.27337 type:complete len:155 (+) Transcript_23614:46-510(+)